MAEASKFILKVTAGTTYDISKQQQVPVNTSTPTSVSSSELDASVHVRIKDYRGLPRESPKDSPYFSHSQHTGDLYSISFSFVPKKTYKGSDYVFGNDFDHPIRDKLPPGFNTALRIVKWVIDPGLDGDAYADEPYLYGPLLSSVNKFRVGEKRKAGGADGEAGKAGASGDEVVEEGGDGDGVEVRKTLGIPDDAKARQTFFLQEPHRKDFEFEEGREYHCDFSNGYLDFNEFALKLPGFTLPIMRHWDGQPLRQSHTLRYVLKRRIPDKPVNEAELLFVVCFTLIPKDQEAADSVDAQVALEKPLTHSEAEADKGSAEAEAKVDKKPEYVDDELD